MKRLSLMIGIMVILSALASANIIPVGTGITGAGPFTWTYDFTLSADQNVNAGIFPTGNPVPHTNLNLAGFLTIYDFAGYVNESCTGPAGWTCSAQNVGFTPDDVLPTDSASIVNITWCRWL